MEKVRIQDDLYHHVNGEWLKTAVIPDDKPTTGGFSDLSENVEKIMMEDFKNFAEGNKTFPDIIMLKDAVKLYTKVLDTKKRNEEGIEPLLPLLAEIQNIENINDFNNKASEFAIKNIALPVEVGVTPDMKNAVVNSFVIKGPDTILPDTTYYSEGNETGKQLLDIYKNMVKKLLEFTPLSSQDQEKYIDDTLEFDLLISKQVKSQLEWADYVKAYNPTSIDEVIDNLKPFDFKKFLNNIYGENIPETIIVYDPKAIKEFNKYFSEDTFEKYLHWAYVKQLVDNAQYLSEELYELSKIYQNSLMGVAKTPIIEKKAYRIASSLFSEPVGVYYGRTYFGEEAKKDVIDMVNLIIDMYKKRIKNNKFLEEKTKEKAILKVSTMKTKMGYPDEIDPFYNKLTVEDNTSYFEAVHKIHSLLNKRNFEKLNEPVNKNEWAMPGHLVNACYNPTSNDITFPAAILQKPFYSLNQSLSENLGGIGAVIGHEISHGFDNNGAHFDENGNLSDWWTEKDFAEFKKLTKDMIEQFDGIPFHGGTVNGELVVSENIADNGGIAVTLAVMNETKDADFEAYFKNWAKIWCIKAKEEYIQLLLTNDVHSPTELRANITPRNFEEWYKTFNVTKNDKMYIEPDKRIIIW